MATSGNLSSSFVECPVCVSDLESSDIVRFSECRGTSCFTKICTSIQNIFLDFIFLKGCFSRLLSQNNYLFAKCPMDRNRITKIAIGPAFQNMDTRGKHVTFSPLLDE